MNRIVMWSATSWPGTEHLEIREGPSAIEMDGLVLAHVDGQTRNLLMVYVAVPEMTYRLERQRYTCFESSASGGVFRYESGSFRRDLRIDSEGLVVDYPGFWRRVGE